MRAYFQWHGQWSLRRVLKLEDWSVALVSPPFRFTPPPVPHSLIARHMTERWERLWCIVIEKDTVTDIPIPVRSSAATGEREVDFDSPWLDPAVLRDAALAEEYFGPFRKDQPCRAN